jgi:type II secretory pathway pseudopilin PulG
MMARAMLKIIIWCARNVITENSNLSIMVVRFKQADKRIAANAFTLAETLIAIVILVLVMSGMLSGYVQINRTALWSSMSLAAQSVASQGAEQARCSKWDTQVWPLTNTGPGTGDELGLTNYTQSGSNYTLDIPVSGRADLCYELCLHHTNFSHSAIATNLVAMCVAISADRQLFHQHCGYPAGA